MAWKPVLAEFFEDFDRQEYAGRLGMWLFLGSEAMLFAGLFALYATYRAMYGDDFLMAQGDNHLARDNDTEIILHAVGHELSSEVVGDNRPSLVDVWRNVSQRFDGAYSLVLLNALGDMLIVRDPLGIKPLC